jgi:hypothetical protein
MKISRFLLTTACLTIISTYLFAWNTPVHSSPSNTSSSWTGITLDWFAVSGSEKYQLQVDTSSSFNSPVLYDVHKDYINSNSSNNDTKQLIEDLFFGTTYFWRVRAYITGDTSAWSTPWTFTTRDYVNLDSPSDASITWTGVEVDWYSHAGVDFYDLEVDTSANFNSTVLISYSKAYINSSSSNSDTDQWLEDLFFGQKYYWRVRARNAVDTSTWSSVWTFTTRDYVNLDSPSDASTNWTGVEVDWFSHAGVDFYDLEVDTSANFNSTVLISFSKTYTNSSRYNTDTEQWLEDLFFGQKYYWRVRARNAVDTSAWSSVWTFTTRNYVNLDSPSDASNTWTGMEVDWFSHAGVDFYDLEVDTSANFNSSVLISYSKAYINSSSYNSDTEQWLEDLFFGQKYYWRVRARNAVDSSAWSSVWTFTTRDYVTLSSPNDGQLNVSVSGINLDWYSHHGIDYYQLQIDTTMLFNSISLVHLDKNYINSSSSNNDTYQNTGPLLTNQHYFWRVRAVNAVDTSLWTTRSFSTGNNPILIPDIPILFSPTNMAAHISVPTNLEWFAANNATSYQFVYDSLPSFSTADTGTTVLLESGNLNLLINKTYYWKVRALNGSAIYSAWSETWSFNTDLSTKIEHADINIEIYPNPASHFINILTTSPQKGNIQIINNTGQLIYATELNSETCTINVENWSAGIYFLHYFQDNRKAATVVFVVE